MALVSIFVRAPGGRFAGLQGPSAAAAVLPRSPPDGRKILRDFVIDCVVAATGPKLSVTRLWLILAEPVAERAEAPRGWGAASALTTGDGWGGMPVAKHRIAQTKPNLVGTFALLQKFWML